MLCVEGICTWFKGLEGDARIELMCSLLDSCLPLELRFLGTYVEFIAGKHYTHLQRWEKAANDGPLDDLRNLSDTKARRNLCIFLTLLYSHNRKTASKLFQIFNNFHMNGLRGSETNTELKSDDDVDNSEKHMLINEIRLLLCMASHHPAFDFDQKLKLRDRIQQLYPTKHENCYPYNKQGSTKKLISCCNEVITQERTPTKSDFGVDVTVKAEPLSTVVEGIEINAESIFKTPQDDIIPRALGVKTDGNPSHMPYTDPIVYPPQPIRSTFYPGQPNSTPVPHITPPPINATVPVLTATAFKSVSPALSGNIVHPTQAKTILHPGANGIVQPYFQPAIYSSNPGSPASTFGQVPPDYHMRCSSAPIPVRTPQLYQPYGQASYPSVRGNNISFPYGMSPLESPCQSPFTSPVPSPITSPRPSPAQSPMFRRKSTGGIGGNKKEAQNFNSVYDWLKSLRLHKYTDVFKDYTFDKMASLTESDLIDLGLTQGARKKFKLNVDALVEKGFQGFGNPNFTGTPTFSSVDNLTGVLSASAPGNKPGSSRHEPLSRASPVVRGVPYVSNLAEHNNNALADAGVDVLSGNHPKTGDSQSWKDSTCSEKSSDEASQGTEGSFDDFISDDEVFLTRRQTVIEIQDFHARNAVRDTTVSCYNCGGFGHLGNECEEDTMETQSYARYGYRLRYNTDDEKGGKEK